MNLKIENRKSKIENRLGQALIEVFFIVVLFIFVGIMGYETGLLYYNVNTISSTLKQAAWAAAAGATDDEIFDLIEEADEILLKSALFEHHIENFAIEVWFQPVTLNTSRTAAAAVAAYSIAPTPCDTQLSPGSANRAAYVWRAQGYNIRVGLTYRAGYAAPYFDASPTFLINLPLSASEVINARNDQDRDGLADIYEPELFELMRFNDPAGYAAWLQVPVGTNGWRPFVHTDSPSHQTDDSDTNLDGDGVLDAVASEAGIGLFDFNNDGVEDKFDRGNNLLVHPRIGRNDYSLPICR